MAESVFFTKGATKAQIYEELEPQLKSLLSDEEDLIANLANFAAVIKEAFEHLWVGFYLVKGEQLVLGPFQGPLACTRIAHGRGVCGTSWKEARTLLVPDVNKFPGHIACSSLSKSEIVIPLLKGTEVVGVLDVDSTDFAAFDETDKEWLERYVRLIPLG